MVSIKLTILQIAEALAKAVNDGKTVRTASTCWKTSRLILSLHTPPSAFRGHPPSMVAMVLKPSHLSGVAPDYLFQGEL